MSAPSTATEELDVASQSHTVRMNTTHQTFGVIVCLP